MVDISTVGREERKGRRSELVLMISGKVLSYYFTTKKTELLSGLAGEEVDISRFDYDPAFPFVETHYPM